MPLNVQKVKRVIGAGVGGGKITGQITTRAGVVGVGSEVGADELFAAWVAGPAAKVPARSVKAGVQAVLFDLDGVLVDTAAFHYEAWKRLAEELGLRFDERMNHGFRGVGRMECLDKLLGVHAREVAGEEKRVLADRKNGYYLERVMTLRPADLAPGARALAMRLRASGIRMGLVSASRNANLVVGLLGITDWFEAIVDGDAVTKGKPDPQGFLLAAKRLRVEADQCVVIEDAEAGIKAGHAAEMTCIGIGDHATGADAGAKAVGELTVEGIERTWADGGN
jgi:beta-phosphoglucomutase